MSARECEMFADILSQISQLFSDKVDVLSYTVKTCD